MNRQSIFNALLITSLFFGVAAFAGDKDTDPVKAAIEKSLLSIRPDFTVDHIEKSEVAGIYEVYFTKAPMIYVTADGLHLFDGKLYKLSEGKLIDSLDEKQKPQRVKALAAIPKDQMIIFSPEGEAKAYVNVFTDVDCGYCQKLHSHIAEINKLGIEVRYLAFPRAGPNSISAKKLANAWCADDRKDALTKLKLRQNIPDKTCDNPVAAEYALGEKLGVNGTPAVYDKNGTLIGGYLDPDQLAQVLGIH